MGLREGVRVRSGVGFGTSSAAGRTVDCIYFKRLRSMESPRSGRPSTFGACGSRLVADDRPIPDGFSEEVLVVWSGTLARFSGEFSRGDIVSKLPCLERLSSLLESGRGISKLTLRPEAGDVGKVRKFEDLPLWLIVSESNRVFPGDVGCAESLCRSFRPPCAKPRLQDPVPGAPVLIGEDLDCRLGDTELGDTSCSEEKSDITSAGCERYGFG